MRSRHLLVPRGWRNGRILCWGDEVSAPTPASCNAARPRFTIRPSGNRVHIKLGTRYDRGEQTGSSNSAFCVSVSPPPRDRRANYLEGVVSWRVGRGSAGSKAVRGKGKLELRRER